MLGNATEELTAAEERYEKLREAASGHEELGLLSRESKRGRGAARGGLTEARRLAEELDDVSGGEDLEKREQGLREEAEKLRELAANHRGRANANEREAKNVDKAREAIVSGAEDHCPTCHRGFESGEQEEISDTLYRQAASLRRLAARDTEEAGKLTGSADTAEQTLQKVSAKIGRWREIQQSLVRAEDRATERLEALKNVRNATANSQPASTAGRPDRSGPGDGPRLARAPERTARRPSARRQPGPRTHRQGEARLGAGGGTRRPRRGLLRRRGPR